MQEEDEIVDEAINATSTRPTSRLEIQLPIRRHKGKEATSTKGLSEGSTTGTSGRPPRARRINRRINSLEVFGGVDSSQPPTRGRGRAAQETIGETPEPERHPRSAQHGRHVTDQALGSPELQSSATKRRPANRPVDIYDVPEDEESGPPSPAQRPRTINGLESLSRSKGTRKPAREPRRPQRNARLSSILEEEQSRSDRAEPRHETRQDTEDRELAEEERSREEFEESDGFEEPWDSENEGGADVEELPSVAIQALPYDPTHGIISLSSAHPNNMWEIMGRSGWTGAGRRWADDLLRSSLFEVGDEPPARTRLGMDIFKSLSDLQDKLDDVPNALDLAGQARFLARHTRALNLDMSNVERAVLKIKDQAARAQFDQEGKIDPRYLDALANDLSTCIIPMLVLILHAAFAVGAEEPNAESNDTLPREGVFTYTTAQYMLWITAWLFRLDNVLMQDLTEQPDSTPPVNQQNDPEDPTQSREKFGVMVRKWRDHLKAGVDAFNREAERKRNIYEKKQRDLAIKRLKEDAEQRRNAENNRHYEIFCASLREIAAQPRPMAEKWHKAAAHWAGSSSQVTGPPATQGSSTPSVVHTTQSRSHTLSAARAPQPRPQPQPALVLDYPPWPEDEVEWFLGELERPDRARNYLHVCAEALDRPLEEVRTEMERLRRAGLYRPRPAGRRD